MKKLAKKMSKMYPWTEYCDGTSLAVASILAITMPSSFSSFFAKSSYLGANDLQWPHHGA